MGFIKYGSTGERTLARWQAELIVAGLLAVTGGVVMADSWRIGIGWGYEGPQAGFFPFFIGLILCGASLVTFGRNLLPACQDQENFVERPSLRGVVAVLVPAVIFVAAVRWIGLYVAAALLIAYFMRLHGRFGLPRAFLVGLAIAAFLFLVFEHWFALPLPKGPLEAWLGY
jgi:hypothetical protein